MRKEAELLNPTQKSNEILTGNERKHSSSIDQFINDDSTSNQSDSSASSSARQQLLHGNARSTGIHHDKPEQITKRTLMTKNAGTTDKRRRVASGSGITFIKREPQTELNDEVCFYLIHKRINEY